MLHVDCYVHGTRSHSRKQNTLNNVSKKKRRGEYFDLRDRNGGIEREGGRERERKRGRRNN